MYTKNKHVYIYSVDSVVIGLFVVSEAQLTRKGELTAWSYLNKGLPNK